jgi:hypothetical protein
MLYFKNTLMTDCKLGDCPHSIKCTDCDERLCVQSRKKRNASSFEVCVSDDCTGVFIVSSLRRWLLRTDQVSDTDGTCGPYKPTVTCGELTQCECDRWYCSRMRKNQCQHCADELVFRYYDSDEW